MSWNEERKKKSRGHYRHIDSEMHGPKKDCSGCHIRMEPNFQACHNWGGDDNDHSDESDMKEKKKWLRSHIVRLHGFSGIPEITRTYQEYNVVRNKLVLLV